jgi:small conductance mechanosensitive channel
MDSRRKQHVLLFIPMVFLSLALVMPVYGQGKEETSAKDLEELVGRLEDPQKREIMIKDLKNLIKLKEVKKESPREETRPGEKKESKVLVIENLFVKFDSLSKSVINSAAGTASLVRRAPEAYGEAKYFFSQPENRYGLMRLGFDMVGSILVALIIWFLLRRYVPKISFRDEIRLRRAAKGFVRVILGMAPYGALLTSLFILFGLFPGSPKGHSLILAMALILFFYRLAMTTVMELLSPEREGIRILPLSDESANYLWIWVARFIRYAVFYSIVIQTLLITGVDSQAFLFVRGLLLIVFPLMLSVFILQVAREIRIKYERTEKNEKAEDGSTKNSKWVLRYWPILAMAYGWAVFVFLIVQYDKGFRYLFSSTLWTVSTLILLQLAYALLSWFFKKLFAINEKVKTRFPDLEEKTNRYIVILRKILRIILMVLALGVIAQVWGIPVSHLVSSKTGSLIILRAIAILITIGVSMAIIETSEFLKEYLLKEKKGKEKKERTQKRKTLVPIMNTALKIAAGFIGSIVILGQLGVNTTPILAGAGIVGLAIGFGAQTLVKDLINGLFILFEESIRVGDYADVGKNEGIVEAVGLRTIRLRDVSGNFHVVPNSSIDTVTNMSKEFSRTVIDVGVAYKEDVDEVMDILREIGEGMRNDPEYGKKILEPIEIFGLQKFDDSAIIVRARMTTKPLKQWGLKREFNRRVKKVFDERGIEIPFPHRTIYMGEPKEGPAAPLEVHMREVKEQGLQG